MGACRLLRSWLFWFGKRGRERGRGRGGFAFVEDCLCLQVPTYLEDLGVGMYLGWLREGWDEDFGLFVGVFFVERRLLVTYLTYMTFSEVQISQRKRERERERERLVGTRDEDFRKGKERKHALGSLKFPRLADWIDTTSTLASYCKAGAHIMHPSKQFCFAYVHVTS